MRRPALMGCLPALALLGACAMPPAATPVPTPVAFASSAPTAAPPTPPATRTLQPGHHPDCDPADSDHRARYGDHAEAARPTATVAATAAGIDLTSLRLVPPFVVDGDDGRLYAAGQVGERRFAVIVGSDGRPLSAREVQGNFAFDRWPTACTWTCRAKGYRSTASMAATWPPPSPCRRRARLRATVRAGGRRIHGHSHRLPRQRRLRNRSGGATVTRSLTLDVAREADCRTGNGPLPVASALLDSESRLLYLQFTTYVCTPWVGQTLIAYDVDSGEELGRQTGSWVQATAGRRRPLRSGLAPLRHRRALAVA